MVEADPPANSTPAETAAGRLFEEYLSAQRRSDTKGQEAAVSKLWQLVAEGQNNEPSEWLRCMQDAGQRMAAFDWVGAEAAYRRAVQVAGENMGLLSKAYDELRSWHLLRGEISQAKAAARSATAASRRLNMPFMLSMRLQAEARLAIEAGELDQARDFLAEAFAVIKSGRDVELVRANALVLRAEYSVVAGELEKAEVDLKSAWEVLLPHSEAHHAGGWQASLAAWWTAAARLRAQKGDMVSLVAAWHEAVARRRMVAKLPQIEGWSKLDALARSLRDLGLSLQTVGDASAKEALAESDEIRAQIGLPPLA